MMAYSMTKVFTAIAVLQLIERGALSLDDSVSTLRPYSPYSKEVTVRHVLSQTLGIPNPIPLSWAPLRMVTRWK
jgi:CubicO group peptidase (beta-lactamase class C family)